MPRMLWIPIAVGAATVAIAASIAAVPVAASEEPDAPPSVEALAFLAGPWICDIWGGKFHAYYSTPQGGKVLSHSELRRDGKVAFFEFEKFEVRESKLVFDPFPAGTPAVGLVATSASKKKVVFENPKKDYPTRITYELVGKDRVNVTLDDPNGESGKTEVFKFERPTTQN